MKIFEGRGKLAFPRTYFVVIPEYNARHRQPSAGATWVRIDSMMWAL